MLKKDQLLEDKEFRDLILEAVYMYKFAESKKTDDWIKCDDFVLNKIKPFLLKKKYCNKDISSLTVRISYRKNNNVDEGITINIGERINAKWYNSSFIVWGEEFKKWMEQ